MNLFRKGFILLFALLFPIIVFLFLKFFGQNEYELSVYKSSCFDVVENLLIENNQKNNNIKLLDVRLDDNNILINNYINKLEFNSEIEVITLSDQLRNLNWLSIEVEKSLITDLSSCINNIEFSKSFILLLDSKNKVRGYFNSTERGEIERLEVEIDILKLEK